MQFLFNVCQILGRNSLIFAIVVVTTGKLTISCKQYVCVKINKN